MDDALKQGESLFTKLFKMEIPVKLNKNMVDKQNLSPDSVFTILYLHERRSTIISIMEMLKEEKIEEIRNWAKKITELDYELQDTWGFKRDPKYHSFWKIPHCSCPKLDNIDCYGTTNRVINLECIIHGYIE